ncbi:MAG TPA: CheR family methyltransferase [Methanotrichaceae archaeon]|nr:CheR family methyltransferase [Methanotrichaceae archaeon]
MAEDMDPQKQDQDHDLDQGPGNAEELGEGLLAEPGEPPLAVVGIGASAGGLEALEEFFSHMPPDSGMAFAVVQHQDPTQASLLPEILQRYTQMPVVEITEGGVKAQPNIVYTKPSDFDLAIVQGSFTLLKPVAEAKGRGKMSIDIFFRHLADDQDGKAVCIVLSGMGHDGTLGIRALKERMGMAMAQEPTTAKFGDMPQSAIATGLVDYVAPAGDLPGMLIDYVRTRSLLSQARIPHVQDPIPESALARIFAMIRSRTGQDFSQYKRSTIMRRTERRMGLHQITRLEDYIRYLSENPQETEILAKEMLIGVTQFFRDPMAWERLKGSLLELIRSKPGGSMLRVWVVGCSTGEEAYSMAMLLQECLDTLRRTGEIQFQIFATDTDADAIDLARVGRYPANIEVDVSPALLERFFIKEDGTYQVSQALRETVIFATHNVIRDPPFSRLDVLSCRNLLIYLSPEMQKRLISLFHYALNPDGILFLGTAESINTYRELFSTLDAKCKIFQSRDASYGPGGIPEVFAASPFVHEVRPYQPRAAKATSITTIAQDQLLERYAPPAVVVTENGDIVYFHGRTGKYLEPSPGKANLNIFAMAREGLRYSIISALRTARGDRRDVASEELVQTDGSRRRVRLTVQPVPKRLGMADLYLVTFEEVPEQSPRPEVLPGEAHPPDIGIADLERELIDARAQIQHMAEEMQSSQEEMTSMNEELQSANEELQSTNEELTTSKEELQSMNEEMQTVNSELQAKIEEFVNNQDDMQNLLQSTRIPILFLDADLRVRRFTDDTSQIVHLIDSDIGRPITDFKVNFQDELFPRDLREVLNTLQLKEKEVMTRDGRWFQMRIRPYRTSENQIKGLVVTFNDITAVKQLELFLRDARNYAENIIATIQEPLVVLDPDLRIVSANRSFYETFQAKPEETVGMPLYAIGNSQWDIPQLRKLLEDNLINRIAFKGYVIEHDFPSIGHRVMLLNARKVRSDIRPDLMLLAIEDITNQPPSYIQQLKVMHESLGDEA